MPLGLSTTPIRVAAYGAVLRGTAGVLPDLVWAKDEHEAVWAHLPLTPDPFARAVPARGTTYTSDLILFPMYWFRSK
jgi:hypothetical protein